MSVLPKLSRQATYIIHRGTCLVIPPERDFDYLNTNTIGFAKSYELSAPLRDISFIYAGSVATSVRVSAL